jgi:hypothetical protein
MAITTNGIYYPTSGDNIAPLEGIFATMATSVDTAIAGVKTAAKIVASGQTAAITVGTSVGNSATASISFGSAFTAAPTITGSLQMTATGSAYAISFFDVTSTGCTVKVSRVNGTTNDGNLFINWIARS